VEGSGIDQDVRVGLGKLVRALWDVPGKPAVRVAIENIAIAAEEIRGERPQLAGQRLIVLLLPLGPAFLGIAEAVVHGVPSPPRALLELQLAATVRPVPLHPLDEVHALAVGRVEPPDVVMRAAALL
jgi:hypothetical protein